MARLRNIAALVALAIIGVIYGVVSAIAAILLIPSLTLKLIARPLRIAFDRLSR